MNCIFQLIHSINYLADILKPKILHYPINVVWGTCLFALHLSLWHLFNDYKTVGMKISSIFLKIEYIKITGNCNGRKISAVEKM